MASSTHHKKNRHNHKDLILPSHGSITQKLKTWSIEESNSKSKAKATMEIMQKHQSSSKNGQIFAYKREVVSKQTSASTQKYRSLVSEKGQFVAIRKEVVTKEVKEVKYLVEQVSYKENKGRSIMMDKNKKQIQYYKT